MSNEPLLVKDLGEQSLLKRLQRFCPADVVGDDGAILITDPDRSLVVTTDVLVDGVHFSDRTTDPFDVGWRSCAANLSDLAAMGATPLGITVGLSLPGEKTVFWVEEVYRGIDACLKTASTFLVGGDVCRSPVTSLAITAFGEVLPNKAIRRDRARVGDVIVVTGLHGLSRGGLELLLDPDRGKDLEPAERRKLIEAHQRPKPRLDVLPYLAAVPDVAGMDSSDGLADAIVQICQCSRVGAIVNGSSLTIYSGLSKLAKEMAWEWLLYGGEDFELVLCLPKNSASNLVEQIGGDAAIIGEITTTSEIKVVYENSNVEKILDISKGFQHF